MLPGGLPAEASMHPAGSGRSRWAQQELGDLLGPSWLDDPAAPEGAPVVAAPSAAPAEPGPSGAIWEVERLPSEAEGGVVSLLLSGRRDGPGGADVAPDQAAARAGCPGAALGDGAPDRDARPPARRLGRTRRHPTTSTCTRPTPRRPRCGSGVTTTSTRGRCPASSRPARRPSAGTGDQPDCSAATRSSTGGRPPMPNRCLRQTR